MLYRLSVLHRQLDDEIRRELKRQLPNTIRLLRLKRLKLAVKKRLHFPVSKRRRSDAMLAAARCRLKTTA
jgi:uncharacterized protein YdcH (DUF465 family)